MKQTPSEPKQIKISLQMTDKDIVEKFANYFNYKVKVINRKTPAGNQAKTVYMIVIKGLKAHKIMTQIKPLMSKRRQIQITKSLDCIDLNTYKTLKFSKELIAEIREQKDEVKGVYLAKKYNISPQTISEILNNKTHNIDYTVDQININIENDLDYRIGWLSGYLDGEASFRLNNSKTLFRISVVSIDKDNLEKICKFGFINKISFISFKQIPNKEHWNDIYGLSFANNQHAKLLILIYPYLCSRRQEKIKSNIKIITKTLNSNSNINISHRKFNDVTENNIKELFNTGEYSYRELGRIYNCNHHVISKIVNNKYQIDFNDKEKYIKDLSEIIK